MQHLQQLVIEAIETSQFPETPSNLYDPIRYILTLGGKRVRPVLTLMAAELFGMQEMEEIIPAAKAVEFFHNFSLIHDDLMDKAPLRRGKTTVHEKWDANIAILSGDGLLVKAYEEISKCNPIYLPATLKILSKVAMEVCEGQQLDMDYESRDSLTMSEYLEMIRLKTSVLLGGALQLGAILSGADEQQQQLIYDFGENVGLAFQLQDDILDAYGDPDTFGKIVGGDIMINKKTFLLVKLMAVISDDDKTVLQALLNATIETAPSKVADMLALYEKYAIKTAADELKDSYTQRAFEKMEALNVPNDRKEALLVLANNLLVRQQ
ncbi:MULTISPECIES: polyprenyl synthetase family protein [Sphingobacterium]|uniref:Heptaprenyl diphosphate synthase component 2 n=1 Tax=Sphingobacterium multivorum TaxID=28454 RepID=A0A654A5H0_SPHMU|nr:MULTISPECIES: polyprenyl synthetase family protein [Sphingobacterium]HAE68566.1 polyprenyl synthetase family protein [Sphingobacterium sp.]OFV21725.1 polyprenyl synthetase [Sphingobacterium sp. HMSC13C05]QQT42850.1 polyprenyl synthetase family protein [Sphingobacterium multivorum]QQT64219.1 polyprenyl synthetase family protein [Sphingobacterium multivorum]SUJ02029.1 Heptaprenyl diphosphate synthase component 2 [Sphingobacterium multivorum]